MVWMSLATALAQDPGLPAMRAVEPLDFQPSEAIANAEAEAAVDEVEGDNTFFDENYDLLVPGTGVEFDMPKVTDIAWQWPLYGRVSSHYGKRTHPSHGGVQFHHGIDIAAAPGRQVMSAGVGVVSYAGRGGGYGNLVEVRHPDGYVTRYAHMTTMFVKAGHKVQGGDPVGTVGNTGRSTGPHLHFELRKNGETEDPAVIAIVFGEPVDARAKQRTAVLRAPAVPGSPLEEGLREALVLLRQLLTLATAPFAG
ncbi:MAG: M23 family metallopeptidase [Myxococcota bacterium]